jgi:hypothetical protein
VQAINDDSVGSFDRDPDQSFDFEEACDQRVDTLSGVDVSLVEQLRAGLVDHGDLMMGGTPINASERGHDLLHRG